MPIEDFYGIHAWHTDSPLAYRLPYEAVISRFRILLTKPLNEIEAIRNYYTRA